MIIPFKEESDYGQDVLDLAGLVALLIDEPNNITDIRKILRQIHGKLNHIDMKMGINSSDYWS